MRNSNEESRSTDRPQNPRECRHYHEIAKGHFVYACCGKCDSDWGYCEYYNSKSVCPNYEPKEEKDNECN